MTLSQLYQKLSDKRLRATLSTDKNSHIVSIFDDRELLDVVFEERSGVEFFYLDKRDYARQRCSANPATRKRKHVLGILHGLLIVLCFAFSTGLFVKLLKPEDSRAFDDSLNAVGSGRVLFYRDKKDGQVYSDLVRAGSPHVSTAEDQTLNKVATHALFEAALAKQ